MLNIDSNINKDRIKNILDNFNGNDNKAEIYFAKNRILRNILITIVFY